jgi:hypothetical protein
LDLSYGSIALVVVGRLHKQNLEWVPHKQCCHDSATVLVLRGDQSVLDVWLDSNAEVDRDANRHSFQGHWNNFPYMLRTHVVPTWCGVCAWITEWPNCGDVAKRSEEVVEVRCYSSPVERRL